MTNFGWVDEAEWKLDQPDEEEAEQLLGGDICGDWEMVGEVVPAVTKDAPQAGGKEVGSVKRLDSIPLDRQYGMLHA
jgi:hypothetical protein